MKPKQNALQRATGLSARDTIAVQAMHGILTACSSPQYVAALLDDAEQHHGGIITKEIADRSYRISDAMIAEGKKKG